MKELIQATPQERQEVFAAVARKLGWSSLVIEKDFWVCWMLQQLFENSEFGEHLIFKGGTSLSKVWKAIHRFSEDIDISLSRELLGFEDNMNPENAPSKKQCSKRLEALSQACIEKVESTILPNLREQVSNLLPESDHWSMDLDPQDAQTILFKYPVFSDEVVGYIQRQVKIEMGARSDHWPAESQNIQPYVSDAFPDMMAEPECSVKTLSIERTFWEKATILHAECHRPEHKETPARFSRHFYDLAMLADHPDAKAAIERDDLRQRVVEHKQIFFFSAWAKYDEAIPGSFRLVPDPTRLKIIEQDYKEMAEMFLGKIRDWNEIIERLRSLENALNN